MKTDLRLEDGQIGEQPEVTYHVFHTLLFGGLALLFDGCVQQHHSSSDDQNFIKMLISLGFTPFFVHAG